MKRCGRIAPEGWSSSDSEGELDKENGPPHKKRPCLSLTKGAGPTGRFKVVSLGSVKQLAVPNPPKNTQNSTSWADNLKAPSRASTFCQ